MSTPDSSPHAEMRKPTPNTLEWNELVTPDPEAAIGFYCELFGWTTEKFPMPGEDYTMFKHNGQFFGGVLKTPEPGIPTHWLNYVSVEDVDAAVEKAKSLGASVCAGPMSIGEAGRIAVISDPQGATIGLHQASGC